MNPVDQLRDMDFSNKEIAEMMEQEVEQS